jgi:trehalose-6-phosphatase
VTDNGANMVKAIRLVSEDFLEEEDVDYCEGEDEDNDDEFEYMFEEEDKICEKFVDEVQKQFKNKHLRCFTHSLQLVVKNGIINTDYF